MHRTVRSRSALAFVSPSVLLATLGACNGLAWTNVSSAAPQVLVSDGLEKTEAAVRDHPSDRPLALLIDAESMPANETESLLHAIEDRRRAGGLTVAIVGPTSNGSTLVALSCDAMVPLPTARLTGADDAWCPSPSRREDLIATVQKLGRVSDALTRRLVETKGSLSWDKTAGFQPSDAGALLVVQDGATLELSAAQLEQTGLAARGFKDLSAATAAIEGRIVRARTAAPALAASPSGSASPSGTAPRGRPSTPPTVPPTGAPGIPSVPSATPSANSTTVDMAKLSPKLKDYQTQLSELKAKVKEFDRYYRGDEGIWTSQHKSLKAIWQSKTEMTRDKDTKLRCSRLQQDIRESITRIESTTRSIEKICDNKANPEVVKTAAALETLKQFREAIQRNEVDDYDKYKPLIDRLN